MSRTPLGCSRDCGFAPADARRRAAIVVTAVVGYQQLVAGGWAPDADTEPRPLIETLFAVATAGAPSAG